MKAAVIGSGAWGTALAIRLCRNGHDVTLWVRTQEQAEQMRQSRCNPRLPSARLPENLKFDHLLSCVSGCDLVVFASPSSHLRQVCRDAAAYLDAKTLAVSATKGLEEGSYLRMSQIVSQETGHTCVVLTGPSHAEEVSADLPTGLLAAHKKLSLAERVQDAFMADTLRVYTSIDPVGAELGGAMKNVIALCAGVADGLGCGDNTRAMLMTRGLTEIARLGVALGASRDTFAGLAGVGDLIVTCTSMHSRNRRAGILIGQGKTADEAMREVGAVVEGYYAARAAYLLGRAQGIEMPITEAAYRVLYENADVHEAIRGLLRRSRRSEAEDASWI